MHVIDLTERFIHAYVFFLDPVILIKKDTSQSLVKVTYCMPHFSNNLVHVKTTLS